MSIRDEVDRVKANVANTYSVLESAGAEMPEEQTSDNLPGTANKIAAVLYNKSQDLTDAQKVQARTNIGALAESELDTAIETALTEAKESGEFDGESINWCGEWTADWDYNKNDVVKWDGQCYIAVTNIVPNAVSPGDGTNDWELMVSKGATGVTGKSAYAYAQDGGFAGTETEFAERLATDIPGLVSSHNSNTSAHPDIRELIDQLSSEKVDKSNLTQNTGDSIEKVMSQDAVTRALKSLTTLPYGGSKEWLEDNGDITQLYQIDGYVWAYIDSTGWTRSGTQFLVVSSESEMTNEGGTAYLLRSGNEGTVYAYTPASGDSDTVVVDNIPETANNGDVITIKPTEVSSTDEMTDTSKQYAMGGKVYAYGEAEVEKEPENVFVPANATLNMRLGTSSESASNGHYVTEYLEFDGSTASSPIVWLPLNYNPSTGNQRIWYCDASKTRLGNIYASNMSNKQDQVYIGQGEDGRYYLDLSKDGNGSTTGKSNHYSSMKYLRISLSSGKTTSITVNDIANVEILFEKDRGTVTKSAWVETEFSVGRKYEATVSGSEVTWTDVGTYVEPTEASWDATAETQNIIDSLSSTANSGDTAVYSVDGYLYSYLNGASWMQTSRYSAPTLAIDGELSLTSPNAVQNKVVSVAIDAIQARANSNFNEINALNEKIANIETGSDTVTIPTFWQDAVDEVISKIKALQVGRNCVTFPFFSDNHQRNGYAGILISHIMKECSIPYCFFGGDSISSGRATTANTEAEMIAMDKAFDTIMSYIPNGRFCRAVGNHDGYLLPKSEGGDGITVRYSRDQVYDLFLREESIAQNKHFGGEGTYYYVDDIASKVRWIVLDTNGGSVDSTQIAWLQNTALSFNESGWSVVFISHQPISNHYHSGISNAADVVSAVVSTATSKSIPIIGCFSGHIHRDIISTKRLTGGNGSNAGTEVADLGFTQVIITSDHTGIAYDDATKHTVASDDQSHAIDFVTINKTTRTVNITRLGIGSDRSYTY